MIDAVNKVKIFKAIVISFGMGSLTSLVCTAQTAEAVKSFPEVTFDKVEAIFGQNLNTDDTTLKTLLLAVAMDQTTPGSPHGQKPIGIPYIIHHGPKYWVSKLKAGEKSLDVLVNNALLLLFTKEKIPKSKIAAFDLMLLAADLGYWPADYYIAESNLSNHLTTDYTSEMPLRRVIDNDSLSVAQDTMARYKRCAELGFAPCQYRIGFWLSNSDKTLKDGLRVLRQAINTTLRDTRNAGTLVNVMLSAAREIVLKGDKAGLDPIVRAQYARLAETYLAELTKDTSE